MDDTTEQSPKKDQAKNPALDSDVFLDLNFVPQWARRPPGAVHARRYRDADEHEDRNARRTPRHKGSKSHRDNRDPRRTHPKSPSRQDPSTSHKSGQRSGRISSAPSRSPRQAPHPISDKLHIRFLPERKAISELAKRVNASHKAYPLLDLAGLLLDKEGLCYVRMELNDRAAPETSFYQCQICNCVALQKEDIEQHITQDHLDHYFDAETETLDPPSGVFTCVAFCGISNQTLGPPNHHSYQEAVKQLHNQQFSHMPLETYRSKIRISHDPEDLEKWKTDSTTRTVYRHKNAEADAAPLTEREAQRFMQLEVIDKNIKARRRVVLQESEAHAVKDSAIRSALHHAWQRELRFPIHTALALRAALRNRHLHVFKAGTGKGIHFVTAVKPTSIDPNTAIPAIRDTLKYLQAHPGCTREELIHDLLGHDQLEDPEAKELLQPISWLAERGHIIEFFNGRLAVPKT